MDETGEQVRRYLDNLIVRQNYPSRVLVNLDKQIPGEDNWPYYVYAKVIDVEELYYGKYLDSSREDNKEIRVANELFVNVELFNKKTVGLHIYFSGKDEFKHPIEDIKQTFFIIVDDQVNSLQAGDVVKVFIDKPTVKQAKVDEVIYPLAVLFEGRR